MRVLAFLTLLLVLGCGGAKPQPVVPGHGQDTVVLLPSQSLGPSFVAQQRLHGKYGEKEFTLDVVVQLAQGKLTIVGLTPFGTRAFVLTQDGTEVELQKFINRELPFNPRYVLDDVHRVFFRGLSGAPDGENERDDHGERISEVIRGGAPVERRFQRLSGQPKGEIVVTFKGAKSPVVAPEVTLKNGWFGYTLRVETLTQQFVPNS
jgi:hypothetical protein